MKIDLVKQLISEFENSEVFKMKVEMEFFLCGSGNKNGTVFFRWNRRGNETFRFHEYGTSVFYNRYMVAL